MTNVISTRLQWKNLSFLYYLLFKCWSNIQKSIEHNGSYRLNLLSILHMLQNIICYSLQSQCPRYGYHVPGICYYHISLLEVKLNYSQLPKCDLFHYLWTKVHSRFLFGFSPFSFSQWFFNSGIKTHLFIIKCIPSFYIKSDYFNIHDYNI